MGNGANSWGTFSDKNKKENVKIAEGTYRFNDQTVQYRKTKGEMEERMSKMEALIQRTAPEIKYTKLYE